MINRAISSSSQPLKEQQNGNGDSQSGCSTDERLINAVRQIGCLGRATAVRRFLKRIDHTVNGTQQTKQRTDPGDNRERSHTPFHLFSLTTTSVFDSFSDGLMTLVAPLNPGLKDMTCGTSRFVAEVFGFLAAGVAVPCIAETAEKTFRQYAIFL